MRKLILRVNMEVLVKYPISGSMWRHKNRLIWVQFFQYKVKNSSKSMNHVDNEIKTINKYETLKVYYWNKTFSCPNKEWPNDRQFLYSHIIWSFIWYKYFLPIILSWTMILSAPALSHKFKLHIDSCIWMTSDTIWHVSPRPTAGASVSLWVSSP